MAEPVVSALLTVLFDNIFNKLRTVFRNEFGLQQGGVKKDLVYLEATVTNIHRELRDAEVKDFKSAAATDWLRRLKYAANEADGILDDTMDSNSDSNDDNQTRVCHPFPRIDFNRVAVRRNLGKRIRSVMQKFDLLNSEKSTLDFGEIDMKRETASTSSEPIGRKEAKEEIIKALLKGADIQTGGAPFVYAIVGFGGIGKTTLAQFIYNDEKVVKNFDARLWVWISQTFDVKIVLRKLIEAHSQTPCQLESLEAMQNQLKDLLNGKKFFIVLDDIWISDADLGEWNKFKSALNCGAIGSSVILTTRQSDVASLAGSHDRHNITLLSEKESWDLFKESSFLEEKQESGELEVTGKQIVQKCGGLPLAVKNLGGSLRSTRVVKEWESVRDSEIWELERSCDILPALKLSLNRLESHSRDCFTFSSIFPKGYGMSKEVLIHLWMANGLIPLHPRLELEDRGNKILNELVLKSFFQISQDYIMMHDLMHDLGHSFRDECFYSEVPNVYTIPAHILQLSINICDTLTTNILETLSKSHPSLRTCIFLVNGYGFPTKSIIFKNLDSLRALDLANIKMNDLPLSIGKSKHLKYLNLSRTTLRCLPDTICTLTNLQTLILQGCSKLIHLPYGIGQLINLRHLDLSWCKELTHLPVGISQLTNLRHLKIHGCFKLTQLPSGIGKLVYLRTLGQFTVGRESGQRITELQGLNHLERLEIMGLQHVRDASEARVVVLKEKKNMSSLSLIWGDLQGSNSSNDEAEGVLNALEPPLSLNGKLVIEGYGGSVFASWIKLLENLVVVELRDCVNCERLPPLGQLPLLKELTIKGMKSLKCIGTDFYGGDGCTGNIRGSERRKIFSSLERLVFEDMPMLEEWHATEVADRQQTSPCPRLKELVLSSCPNLTLLPLLILSFVQQIEILHCHKVIVRSLSCLICLVLDGNHSFPDGSLQNLDALESLIVKAYSELTSLPKELSNLTSLRTLEILRCPVLQSLPFMGSSLVKMRIYDCQSLKSLPQSLRDLSSLESLTVDSCDQLEFLVDDFQNLISLVSLRFDRLPRVTSLPNLQYLSTLQELAICNCKNLRLWPQGMQNLRVLEKLTVFHCEQLELSTGDFQHLVKLQSIHLYGLNKLTSVPELQHLRSLQDLRIGDCQSLNTLPPGTSLQRLVIQRCHRDLHLRCEKDKGEYWPFISHIQQIYISP